jgi:peptide/nickel transport system permease protein
MELKKHRNVWLKKWIRDHKSQLKEYRYILRLAWKSPLTMFGLVIILMMLVMAIFAPWVAPYPKQGEGTSNLANRLKPPTYEYPFGTDFLGRDILSRVIYGAGIALQASIVVVALAAAIGTPLGAIAGYFGGKIDEVIMRITDIFLAFPALLLSIIIVATVGPSLTNAMISLSISWWPWYTRLVRGQAISLRERLFVEAARAIGVSNRHIIFHHILPNCLSPVIVQATLDMGYAILATSSLSFLGLGAKPPTADWGLMLSEGREFVLGEWWCSVFPGMIIFITILAFNFVGDWLRVAMDPKMRKIE